MRSTPESLVLQARQQFDALLACVASTQARRLDRVENDLFGQLLQLGLTLVRAYLAGQGTGDVGPELTNAAGTWKRLADRRRRYVSVFGELFLDRAVYGTREKQQLQAVPLDAHLGLPDGDFSYLLQDWFQDRCLDSAYAGAIQGLAAILRLKPSVRSVEHMTRQMAAAVPDFQAQQPLPPATESAELLVATADHKGVPMVPKDRPAAARDHEDTEHPGVKRAACAGAVYTTARFVRTADDVLDEVRRQERAADRPPPQGKVVWAELRQEVDGAEVSGREVVLANLCVELDRRDPTHTKAAVVLCDGERALWTTFAALLTRPFVAILDLWHALTYLWLAAKVFHQTPRAREAFVTARLRMLLEGKVGAVIKGLKQMRTQQALAGEKQRTLAKVIGYLERNRDHMRYDEYLRAGYPIGSGVIEGACRHVIKDRMERAGMLWTLAGASALLRLRVVHTNGHWDAYQEYRIGREQEALHGADAPHALAA